MSSRGKQLLAAARSQSLLSVAAFGASLLVLTVTTPVMVRHLGPDQYGAWVLTGGIVAYVSIVDFGLSLTVSRFVAQSYAHDRRRAREALTIGVISVSLIGCAVAIASLAVANGWERHLGVPDAGFAMRCGGVAAGLVLISKVLQSALTGAGRVAQGRWLQSAQTMVFGIGAVAITLHQTDSPLRSLSVFLLVQLAVLDGALLALLMRSFEGRPFSRPRRGFVAEVLRYTVGIQASSFLGVAVDPMSRFILAGIAGPGSVAALDIALRTRAQWIGIWTAFTAPLAPALARDFRSAADSGDEVHRLGRQFAVVVAGALLAAVTALLVLFPALFGADVGREASLLAVLSIILWTPTVVTLPAWSQLLIWGHNRDIVIPQFTAAISGMALTLALIPFVRAWGPVVGLGCGAALSAGVILRRAATLGVPPPARTDLHATGGVQWVILLVALVTAVSAAVHPWWVALPVCVAACAALVTQPLVALARRL